MSAQSGDSAGTATPLQETNAGLTAGGTLTVTDVDLTDNVNMSIFDVSHSGPTGGLTDAQLLSYFSVVPGSLAADPGTLNNLNWSFDSGTQAFDFLAPGEELTLQYTVRASDDSGTGNNIGDGVVTVRIAGTNDAPAITGGATAGAVKEDNGSQSQATGQLTVVDPDNGATKTWTVVGGTPSGTADYHFRMDTLKITKGLTEVLLDDFSDGVPPPNSPPFNNGQPNQTSTSYGVNGTFTELGGKLFLDSNNAVSFVGVGTNDPIIGQDAIVRTNVDANTTGPGLKIGTQFTISGVFDIVLPDSPRETYGIRVIDRLVNPVTNADSSVTAARLGDDTFELVVRKNVGGQRVVSLRELNFATDTLTNIQSFNLNAPVGADQIVLQFNHNPNDGFVTASFQYIDHLNPSAILGSQSFSTQARIFGSDTVTTADDENWTRAEIVAYAPQFTDSILGGSYGALDINQSGGWTYLIDNSLASTQSLSEGQHVTETFDVKVADQYGAFDTETIHIDVFGTNDGSDSAAGAD